MIKPKPASKAAPVEPLPEGPIPVPPVKARRSPKASQSNLAVLADGVIAALAAAGGADYLLTIARDDPKTFCALLTRILPARTEGKAESGVALRWDTTGGGE